MKIKKTIQQEVEEEIDLSTPKYFKTSLYKSRLTKDLIINVHMASESVTIDEAKNYPDSYYNTLILNVIDGQEITEGEFYESLSKTIDKINSLAGISNVPTLQLQEA